MVGVPVTTIDADYVTALRDIGTAAGLAAVAVAPAEPFTDTRTHLETRRRAGLHAGMQFTYRNPARSTDPTRALPGARAIVVGALPYGTDEHAEAVGPPPRARVARYARSDHYARLRDALGLIAAHLTGDGWRVRVLADDNALVDREAAYRAGLGWYGKNTNVLLPGQGSWFVLGSVLTDAPLPPNPRPVADGCGSCRRCLDGCPTGAIVAPGMLDARRCLAWLVQAEGPFPREYRVALGDRLYGCDDCQEVCPPNRVALRRRADGPAADPWVDVLGLLAASDAELMDRFGRWYIPNREPRYLRRNALVVLGNVGDGHAPEVAGALSAALNDPDPLVRGHAVWAARRLGRDDLLPPVADDPDPGVRAELAAPVPIG